MPGLGSRTDTTVCRLKQVLEAPQFDGFEKGEGLRKSRRGLSRDGSKAESWRVGFGGDRSACIQAQERRVEMIALGHCSFGVGLGCRPFRDVAAQAEDAEGAGVFKGLDCDGGVALAGFGVGSLDLCALGFGLVAPWKKEATWATTCRFPFLFGGKGSSSPICEGISIPSRYFCYG